MLTLTLRREQHGSTSDNPDGHTQVCLTRAPTLTLTQRPRRARSGTQREAGLVV